MLLFCHVSPKKLKDDYLIDNFMHPFFHKLAFLLLGISINHNYMLSISMSYHLTEYYHSVLISPASILFCELIVCLLIQIVYPHIALDTNIVIQYSVLVVTSIVGNVLLIFYEKICAYGVLLAVSLVSVNCAIGDCFFLARLGQSHESDLAYWVIGVGVSGIVAMISALCLVTVLSVSCVFLVGLCIYLVVIFSTIPVVLFSTHPRSQTQIPQTESEIIADADVELETVRLETAIDLVVQLSEKSKFTKAYHAAKMGYPLIFSYFIQYLLTGAILPLFSNTGTEYLICYLVSDGGASIGHLVGNFWEPKNIHVWFFANIYGLIISIGLLCAYLISISLDIKYVAVAVAISSIIGGVTYGQIYQHANRHSANDLRKFNMAALGQFNTMAIILAALIGVPLWSMVKNTSVS